MPLYSSNTENLSLNINYNSHTRNMDLRFVQIKELLRREDYNCRGHNPEHRNRSISMFMGSTYIEIGTTQRRLAWPQHKDDTKNCEALRIFFDPFFFENGSISFRNNYVSCSYILCNTIFVKLYLIFQLTLAILQCDSWSS